MVGQETDTAAPSVLGGLQASARRVVREVTNGAAYRALVAQAKYPVGAMLISQTILGFGVAAVLSHSLGKVAFGQYAVIITVAGIFQLIAAFPVESGLAKFIAESRQENPVEVPAYYAAGFAIRAGSGGLAMLVALLGAGWLSTAFHVPGLSAAVVVACLSLCVFTPLAQFFLGGIQGMEQPARWATGNLLNSLLVFPFTVLGALGLARWGHGQSWLFAMLAVGWLLACLVCGILARRAMGFIWPTQLQWRYVRRLLPFLLPMWIVPLVGFGTKTVLKLYLARKCGPVPVGQFEIALTLLVHMGTIYQACMIIFIPAWSRLYIGRQAGALLHSISQVRGALLGAAFVYGAILVLGGQWVVPAIFGQDQIGAVPAARIMGLTMPLMISGWVASSTNVVSNRTGNIGWANVVWFSIAIPLGILLTPSLGSLGTALAWCGAYIVFAWFYISRARPFFREVEAWAEEEGRP
jgi:O-antigen/teichoic acid export membrane protein